MALLLAFVVLIGFALWRGWSRTRMAGAAAMIWAGVAAALAITGPQGPVDAALGFGLPVWVMLGVLALVVFGYATGLGWLRRRAEHGATVEQGAVAGAIEAPATAAAAPPAPSGPMSGAELDRYARHLVLREIGGAGQMQLRGARVLIVGAGGLGSPVALYLAAAGVGRITISDNDTVSLSNLQRQVIFRSRDAGHGKAEAAAAAMSALNPHIAVTPLPRRVTADDVALIAGHDLVIDGSDSFASRAAVNRACVAAKVPLLAGAISQWEGQVTLYDPARGAPCMACLFPEAPAPGLAPACAEAGVVGALPGVIGSLMALEAIKHLAGVTDSGAGRGLRGRMLIFDGLFGETRMMATTRRADCPVCGGGG